MCKLGGVLRGPGKVQVPVGFLVHNGWFHVDHSSPCLLVGPVLVLPGLGQPLISAWVALLWSLTLPMGDARHGAEGSAESPE